MPVIHLDYNFPHGLQVYKLPLEYLQLAHLVAKEVHVVLGCDPVSATL